MMTGSCHCGAVHWRIDSIPDAATACNCSVCRRYGVLWAYGHVDQDIHVTGPTQTYLRGEHSIGFHFCGTCGCVVCWRAVEANKKGLRRTAVNLRLAEPDAVADIPVQHFDGLHTWTDLPQDGRCVKDMWF